MKIESVRIKNFRALKGLPPVWLTPDLWGFVSAGRMSACPSPGGASLRDGHLPCLRIGGRPRIPTRAVEAYVVHLVLE